MLMLSFTWIPNVRNAERSKPTSGVNSFTDKSFPATRFTLKLKDSEGEPETLNSCVGKFVYRIPKNVSHF